MNLLVGEDISFSDAVQHLKGCPRLSFDTETTGLRPYNGDSMFSCSFYDGEKAYYFLFSDTASPGAPEVARIPRSKITELQPIFSSVPLLYEHNAKFDMHMMDKEGVTMPHVVWCTQTMARVVYNDHMKYDLASCGDRIGIEKDDAVEDYIKKHKLWEWYSIPGKKQRKKNKFYHLVPHDVMYPYACQDAKVCWAIGEKQREEIVETSNSTEQNKGKLIDVAEMETKCTKVFFKMEKHGVPIDARACVNGARVENTRIGYASNQFEEITGVEFVDSSKVLQAVFHNFNLEYGLTDKNNPSFTDEVLEGIDHKVVKVIQTYRDAYKRGGTYFNGFLHWADEDKILHANIRQAGTKHGRLSYAEPNLQNMSKDDEGVVKIRSCIVPPKDFIFCSIDYDQMEFKMTLEYAGEYELIRKIVEDGYDCHDAAAELTGLTRKHAKVFNFGLIYGMGDEALSKFLKCSVEEAGRLKAIYFRELPKVAGFLKVAKQRAKSRGYTVDWYGRRFHCPKKKFAYKHPNYIISGGCSTVVRLAMIEIDDLMEAKKARSKMFIQIHDEILFGVHKNEIELIPEFKSIMEKAYPHKRIPLTCSVETSETNFAEMRKYEMV